MSRRKIWGAALVLLVLTTLPYLLAIDPTGQSVFGGFLFNPNDGNSYLAKMLQGWNGVWRFVLPYTAEPGSGAYLFLFYITLGHLARLLHLPLIFVFHLARALASLWLVFQLAAFYKRVFDGQPRLAWSALLLSVFGSGLGWIVVLAGSFASDMWVAEAYPFLSAYANPHFPFGLALVLAGFLRLLGPASKRTRLELFALGLLISIIMPFGLVVLAVVSGVWAAWTMLDARKLLPGLILTLACLFAGGGAFLVYQYAATLSDPVLAGWNAQNVTTSPPLWDVLLSFSPALLLGLAALPGLWQRRANPAQRLLLTWFGAGLLLVYIPFSLQRRFLLGFYIPVAAAGMMGLARLARRKSSFNRLYAATLVVSLLTNAGVLLAGWVGIQTRDPLLYLTPGEQRALDWISARTPPEDMMLASPQMGLFIPGRASLRVIYGHPFETVNAIQQQQAVEKFFGPQAEQDARALLRKYKVDYIFYGPREVKLGRPAVLDRLEPVYQQDGVAIYRVGAFP